ncbi:DM13 domain-containing protein [Streptomyces sp. XD-27]|uniref:DM13 domain-containing protein n=1 Tax=Streptomyces sp. XD-27 TaxID=3062779 RepID=UPI0026F416DD|nr:DM13 domain-containing protein [Streptomyces sp. XD-27]WKX68834.1 DM13 domain-containing protein [Streptomyces sp. XD-27]
MSRVSRRIVVPALVVLVVVAGIGLYLFQPWKAFIDTTVNEALPTASAPAVQDGPGMKDNAGTGSGEPSMKDAGRMDLARGGFVTHEHGTSGTARTIRLSDGGQVLRLEDLKTSDGPDVRVYLSPRGADAVKAGLGDGAVELGKLKGNLGNQNYTVPAGTDLSGFRSAVIWCKRFSVSFGAADLDPVAG